MATGRGIHARTFRTARGLAALEAVLLFVIVAAGLVLLAGQVEASRQRLRQQMADRQLAVLREALVVYYLEQGALPPGRNDLAARPAWQAMRAVPAVARVLAGQPASARAPEGSEPLDPWRRPYRYLCPTNAGAPQVIDNGGWTLFLSAGPDGDFGDADPTAETDNRRTDELPLPAGVAEGPQ